MTGRILAVSRRDNSNDFGLPGGVVEPGETEAKAAARELREETGALVRVAQLKEIFRREGGVTFKASIFDIDGVLQPRDGETGRVDWVTKEQLMAGSFGDYNMRLLASIGRLHAEDVK